MTAEVLDNEAVIRMIQASIQENPVIVLGSGASAPHIPGMAALAKHLEASISPDAADATAWDSVRTKLIAGAGLEEVLISTSVPDGLVQKIVLATWKYLDEADRAYFQKTLTEGSDYPLSRLLRALHQTSNASSTVITSNYDRLVEYAADQSGFDTRTGFIARHRGNFCPDSLKAPSVQTVVSQKTLRILKPHGSLDWYIEDGSNPFFIASPPKSERYFPLIVTPGTDKYRRTLEDPLRSILSQVDIALQDTGSIACFGYGFNDSHLHQVITRRLAGAIRNVLIVAKELSHNAKKHLGHKSVIAIEQSGDGSRVTLGDKGCVEMPNHLLWSLDGFSRVIL